MNGSYFPGGRKGIICAAVCDIAASDAFFAASEGSLMHLSSADEGGGTPG